MAEINGTDNGETLDAKKLANVTINAGGGDDLVIGRDGNATLNGGDGDDTLMGGSGNTVINDGEGNDLILGGDGDTTINVGPGTNTIIAGSGATTVNIESGDNAIIGGDGDLTVNSLGGNSTITLGDGNANLNLGGGNDSVIAGSGDVTLSGGDGNDTFVGGDGNIDIDGGDGDDTIILGGGGGTVTGGEGNDTYVFGPDAIGDTTLADFDPTTDTIDLSQFPDAPTFGDDGNGGTTIIVGGITITVPNVPPDAVEDATETNPSAPCFLRGTRILTTNGEVAVEDLSIGDMVLTLDGPAKPVKWIGRRGHSARFIPRVPTIEPVCFRAGSLGENVPSRDLFVSHDHAMFIDGVFVDAARLVNGTTIVRAAPAVRLIEYFHVELDAHEVIFASGTPSESYANHGNRAMFQNATEYDALYETDAVARALPGNCHERRHPTIYSGARLNAIRETLARRAEEMASQDAPLALTA